MGSGVPNTAAKQNVEDPIQTVDEIFHSKQQYVAISGRISPSKIENFRQALGQTNVVGFSWLLKPEADKVVHELVPLIEAILFSEEYFKAKDKEKRLTF